MQLKKQLGTFSLAMITVAAIVSLRNLPMMAHSGFASIFFLLIAAITFFVPIALVTAELASGWPGSGGCYVWVSAAFGKRAGFFTLWVAWMESIAWFPAILIFAATMVAHMLMPLFPGLENNHSFILIIALAIFWGATLFNFLGINTSSLLCSLGVCMGTVIPGILIIGFGLWWILMGHPLQIEMTVSSLIPNFDVEQIVIFSGFLLGLAGVELSAFHVKDVNNPQRTYPRATAISSILILLVYVLGTLAIAVVVPQSDISLASGLVQAFDIFFTKVGLAWVVPFLAFVLLMGSIASINAWCVGPAKGMLVVAEDGFLPPWLKKVNKNNAPTNLLILQGVIGSVLFMIFEYYQDSNASIWILTALAAQFTFAQYFMVFIAALKLRISQPQVQRCYKAPFLPLVVGIGVLACIFSFIIVYVPPSQINFNHLQSYRGLLLLAFTVLSLPPMLLIKLCHKKLK